MPPPRDPDPSSSTYASSKVGLPRAGPKLPGAGLTSSTAAPLLAPVTSSTAAPLFLLLCGRRGPLLYRGVRGRLFRRGGCGLLRCGVRAQSPPPLAVVVSEQHGSIGDVSIEARSSEDSAYPATTCTGSLDLATAPSSTSPNGADLASMAAMVTLGLAGPLMGSVCSSTGSLIFLFFILLTKMGIQNATKKIRFTMTFGPKRFRYPHLLIQNIRLD